MNGNQVTKIRQNELREELLIFKICYSLFSIGDLFE
jgi:hypothetical protein